ncbi:unnamed protein product, partial [Symbiodinium pilosum]
AARQLAAALTVWRKEGDRQLQTSNTSLQGLARQLCRANCCSQYGRALRHFHVHRQHQGAHVQSEGRARLLLMVLHYS